jgi:hypothetical protein
MNVPNNPKQRDQVPDSHPSREQREADRQSTGGLQALSSHRDPSRPMPGHNDPGPAAEQQHRQALSRVDGGQDRGAAGLDVQREPEQRGVTHHRSDDGEHLRAQVPSVPRAGHAACAGSRCCVIEVRHGAKLIAC